MRALAVATVLVLSLPLHAQDGTPFDPGCPLPFDATKMVHSLDSTCGPEGVTSDAGNALQNKAKNDFCQTGTPAWITRTSFVKLQAAADKAGVKGGRPPEDRSPLQGLYTTSEGETIGEGSLVHFVGFIITAHHSNVSNGESVNCKLTGRENNDIHIVLDEVPDVADDCHTVTAEMSPHFRPEDWDPGVLEELGRPVRLTGHLFFDGSHNPCRGKKRASPARASVWEIHPVYQVDVCKNTKLTACPVDNDSLWTPLKDFVLPAERNLTEPSE